MMNCVVGIFVLTELFYKNFAFKMRSWREAFGLLSLKLLIANIVLIIGVSFGIVIIMIVIHLSQTKPKSNGDGYHNPSYFKIETQTECTVLNPIVECLNNTVTHCAAQVKYTPNKSSSLSTIQRTHYLFSKTSKYAQYTTGQIVTCYYDPYRLDLVSYVRETNANMKYGGMIVALILVNLMFLIMETIGIGIYVLWRRYKWNKLYEHVR
jgi:hypothetical protein